MRIQEYTPEMSAAQKQLSQDSIAEDKIEDSDRQIEQMT
jgi:hypothetical protein